MADNLLIKDGANSNATLRTVDVGTNLHVPLQGRFYPDKADVTGSLAAVGNQVVLDVRNLTGLVIAASAAAVSGCTAVFEGSVNSTNGTDGTWYSISAQRSSALDTFENGWTTLSATPAYMWAMSVAGFSWVRVRCTAIVSGSMAVVLSPCDDLMFPSRAPTAIQVTNGQAAHDAAVAGNPMRVGAKAVTAMPSAVSAANDVADSIATAQGSMIVTLDGVSAQRLRASLALTLTSDVALFVAQGAGIRSHLSDMQIINTGTAVDLIIKDGTTEIWRLPLPQNIPVMLAGLRAPLQSTANTAMNVALSAAGTVRLNAQGFAAV
jgi:hypothetical protein